MKFIRKYILLFMIFFVLYACADNAHAAALTNNELIPNTYAEITGEGFGELSDGSYICFNVNSKCFNKESFQTITSFSWSDTKITFGVPGDIPLSGAILVYNAGKRTTCTTARCIVQDGVKELARLSYVIQPIIRGVSPVVWERDASVTIKGAGFGDAIGTVLFDDLTASVMKWSDTEVVVHAPSSGIIRKIIVQSVNGKRAVYDLFSYLDSIQAQKAWSVAGGATVIVAVIDDGLYLNHPELKNYVWKNPNEIQGNNKDDDGNGYVDDAYGYNFINHTASVDPNGSHGTHVASIVLSVVQSAMTGSKSNVRIMPLVVADAKGIISSGESVIQAIRYAADNGAAVINISFGSGGTIGYSKSYDEAIQYAFDRGAIVVAAAGNDDRLSKDGTDLNVVPQSPVCNNKGHLLLLGVAALDTSDSASDGRRRARWSSYGSNCIQIAAPGTSIPGAIPPQYSLDKNSYYEQGNGTSFAAPIVSGVAAMMKATFPSLPNWELMNRIIASSDVLVGQGGAEGTIGGRVNAYHALSNASLQPVVGLIEPPESEPGRTMVAVLPNFSSQFQLKLINERASFLIDQSHVRALAADVFEIPIPQTIDDGIYRLAISLPSAPPLVTGQSTIRIQKPPLSVQGGASSAVAVPQTNVSNPSAVSWLDQEAQLSLRYAHKPTERLKGRILLQVEEQGQAWYVNPADGKRYYMKDGMAAFDMLRRFGLGIRANDLATIPREGEKISKQQRLGERMKGKILIDVEHRGEAWYVNPADGRRYYLKDGQEAYRIMRQLALGISNAAVRTIPLGR